MKSFCVCVGFIFADALALCVYCVKCVCVGLFSGLWNFVVVCVCVWDLFFFAMLWHFVCVCVCVCVCVIFADALAVCVCGIYFCSWGPFKKYVHNKKIERGTPQEN